MPIDALEPQQTSEQRRIAQLESELALTRAELKHTQDSLERLREQYTRALEQLQLARRRLFVAKSERVDSKIEQLTFERLLGEVEAIEKALDAAWTREDGLALGRGCRCSAAVELLINDGSARTVNLTTTTVRPDRAIGPSLPLSRRLGPSLRRSTGQPRRRHRWRWPRAKRVAPKELHGSDAPTDLAACDAAETDVVPPMSCLRVLEVMSGRLRALDAARIDLAISRPPCK